MSIDILKTVMHLYTLIFVQFGVLFVSYIALHLIFKLDRNNIGIKFWRDGALISSVGALSLTLFNHLPLALSVIPGVSGIMIGYVFFLYGTTSIVDETSLDTKWIWVISIIILALISLTTLINDYSVGYGLRVIVMSFALTVLSFLSAKKVFSVNHKITTGSFFLIIAFWGVGIIV